jgi:hypothetical protein
MELACPQCGATSREDSVDFPLCTHCHEALVKCGYCAHYDSAAGVCRDRKSGRRKVSANDGLDCPRYRSILATTIAFTQRVISPAKWVLMMAGVLFALIVVGPLVAGRKGPGPSTGPTVMGVQMQARWTTDPPPTVGRPFRLEFLLSNPDTRASGPVRISMPAAFLNCFKVLSITPRPTNRRPKWGGPEPEPGQPDRRYLHYFDFPSVRLQGESVITFELVTKGDFARTGFPFQVDPNEEDPDPDYKYAYDLTGAANGNGLKGLGVHVYNSNTSGIFSAPLILEIKTRP